MAKRQHLPAPFHCFIDRTPGEAIGFGWFVGWTTSAYEGCKYRDFVFYQENGFQRGIMVAYSGVCPTDEQVIAWINENDCQPLPWVPDERRED